MLKIHGVPFSAHTRKVIVAAIETGVAYEMNVGFRVVRRH
jgi:hypothetical protein